MENKVLLASHPIEIYTALDTVFAGEPWLQWEPETIILHLKGEVCDQAIDKLCAVQAVGSNSNVVCTSANAFEKTVNAFCNNICVMDAYQPPYVEEMCYAVPQIELIIKAVHGKKGVFTSEVPGYVAAAAHYRGWMALPACLGFAEEMLVHLNGLNKSSEKYHRCKKLVDDVRDLCKHMDRPTAEDILKSDVFKELEPAESYQLKNIVGAVLFDPTSLY